MDSMTWRATKGTCTSTPAATPASSVVTALRIGGHSTGSKITLSNTDITRIDLQLFDESFNYINFNNINWSILFGLYITYQMPLYTIPTQINDKPIENKNLSQLDFLNS